MLPFLRIYDLLDPIDNDLLEIIWLTYHSQELMGAGKTQFPVNNSVQPETLRILA
jgi:hypothetical protein